MMPSRVSSQRCRFGINVYFLTCGLFLNILLSAALAEPGGKGKGIGRNNPHANPHANLHINPHGNIRGRSGLAPATTGSVNPAGVIVGSGGAKINGAGAMTSQGLHLVGTKVSYISTVTSSSGYVVMTAGNNVFLGQPGSNVVLKLNSQQNHIAGHVAKVKVAGGKKLILAAGDIFSQAIANLSSLPTSLDVPDPIGAKGPNPVHGGSHPDKGDGNPGGGNGNGHWGEGNQGNGVGNTWTGNQGRGVGEGMAGGSKPEPPEPPEPPVDNGEIYIEPAPLHREAGGAPEEEEFAEGSCPALMNWLAAALGIEEKMIQIAVAATFICSTDIHPCEMAARLQDAAKILEDPNGTGVAALARVVNEFIAQDAPISEEQIALIATALASHTDEGTHYAAAGRWLDALVEYVSILEDEMGWSADDAVTLVMDKYGAPIKESDDASLIAYVEARLAALVP